MIQTLRHASLLCVLCAVALVALPACDEDSEQALPAPADVGTTGGGSDAAVTSGDASAPVVDDAGAPSTDSQEPEGSSNCDALLKTISVDGRIVDPDGAPVEDVSVLACTDAACLKDKTNADGYYCIKGLAVRDQKMQVVGGPKGYHSMIWFQPSPGDGETGSAGQDIQVVPLGDGIDLKAADGGTALLAGSLEVSIAPDALVYPIGVFDELIFGTALDISVLPPFDARPWEGKESESMAFVVNPFYLETSGDATFGIALRGAGVADGARHDVYVADHGTALLTKVGTTTGADGDAVLAAADSTCHALTTVIFVPAD